MFGGDALGAVWLTVVRPCEEHPSSSCVLPSEKLRESGELR